MSQNVKYFNKTLALKYLNWTPLWTRSPGPHQLMPTALPFPSGAPAASSTLSVLSLQKPSLVSSMCLTRFTVSITKTNSQQEAPNTVSLTLTHMNRWFVLFPTSHTLYVSFHFSQFDLPSLIPTALKTFQNEHFYV